MTGRAKLISLLYGLIGYDRLTDAATDAVERIADQILANDAICAPPVSSVYPMRWESQILALKGDVGHGLNDLGREGWQLCAVLGMAPDGMRVIVQRPRRLIDTDVAKALPLIGPPARV